MNDCTAKPNQTETLFSAFGQNQDNPPIECTPQWATNITCGAWNGDGELEGMYHCVEKGENAPDPTLKVPPTFSNGRKRIFDSAGCPGSEETVSDITYSVGPIIVQDPPDTGTPGHYSSLVFVYGMPSDDGCNPIKIELGWANWTVVETDEVEQPISIDPLTFIQGAGELLGYLNSVPGMPCGVTPPKATSTIKFYTKEKCCGLATTSDRRVEGTIEFDAISVHCLIPGLSIPIKLDNAKLGAFIDLKGSASASLASSKIGCGPTALCVSFGASVTISAGVEGKLEFPEGWTKCGVEATVKGSTSFSAKSSCVIGEDGSQTGKLDYSLGGLTLSCEVTATFLGGECELFSAKHKYFDPYEDFIATSCLCF